MSCKNHWHCDATTMDGCGLKYRGAVGSSCPDCGMVMMPGGEVTAGFHAEYKTRLANKICLRSVRIKRTNHLEFVCDRPASPAALAGGACLCESHNE